jgi:hypothetical protein
MGFIYLSLLSSGTSRLVEQQLAWPLKFSKPAGVGYTQSVADVKAGE